MARRVLDDVRDLRPLACLDIHNTSGNNPLYACVHRLDDRSLNLARAFSPTSVYVTHPGTRLLRPLATVRVPEEFSFSFDDQPHSAAVDLCFRSDLDGYNFSTLTEGTAVARIRQDCLCYLMEAMRAP